MTLLPNLVLTRKVGQRVWIGDHITLTVVSIDRGKVKLAFEAPREVVIDREEVALRKMEDRKHDV